MPEAHDHHGSHNQTVVLDDCHSLSQMLQEQQLMRLDGKQVACQACQGGTAHECFQAHLHLQSEFMATTALYLQQ